MYIAAAVEPRGATGRCGVRDRHPLAAGACSSGSDRSDRTQGSRSSVASTTAPRAIGAGTKGVPTEIIDGENDSPLPGQDYDNSRTARTSRISRRRSTR